MATESSNIAPVNTALGHRFWKLWGASTLSGLGDGVVLVAFPLLATSFTRSPQWVAGIMVAQRLPWLLLSLPGGALADRVNRRRLLAAIELLRAATLLGVGVAAATHSLTLVLLYAAAATLGGFEAVFWAASHATLPTLVEPSQLPRANGYLQSAQIAGSQFIGPALGGLLLATGTALPFVLDGVSFLASGILLASAVPKVRRRSRSVSPTTVTADVIAGVRWFRSSAMLRLLALFIGVLSFCWAMVTAVTVLYGLRVLHLSGIGYGLFLAVGAIGEVTGGIVAARLVSRFGTAAVVIGGAFAATVAYVTIGLTSALLAATGAIIVESFGIGVANVATMSLRQAVVPPELLGRVGSAFRMCVYGAVPFGALAGGFLAHAGLRLPFICAAAIQAALMIRYGPKLARRIKQATDALAQTEAVDIDLVELGAQSDEPVLELLG
jgi:MFS family permease